MVIEMIAGGILLIGFCGLLYGAYLTVEDSEARFRIRKKEKYEAHFKEDIERLTQELAEAVYAEHQHQESKLENKEHLNDK